MIAASAVICALQFEALSLCLTREAGLACLSCLAGSAYLHPSSSETFASCDALKNICSNLESSWSGCACQRFCEAELEDFYQCSMPAGKLDCDEDLCCFSTTHGVDGRNDENEKLESLSTVGQRHRKLQIGGILDWFLAFLNLFDIFNIIPDPPPPSDRPPVANDDAAITYANTQVVINVLANDFDPDGDELKLSAIVTKPSNGEAVINRNGTVTYTPDLGFSGIDTFGYEVTTGEIQPTAAPLTASPTNSPVQTPTPTLAPTPPPTLAPTPPPTPAPAPTPPILLIKDTPHATGTLPPNHERALQTDTDRGRVEVTVLSDLPPDVCAEEDSMFINCCEQSRKDNGCDGLCIEGRDDHLADQINNAFVPCADQETQTCSKMKSHWELRCNNCDVCQANFEIYYSCLIKEFTKGQQNCGSEFTCFDSTVCFSPSNIVDVEHKGAISITELEIGDLVRINEKGEYSRVYSFGHLDHASKTNYLQIFAEGLEQPLEISPNHFLFVNSKLTPASMVKKGDILNGNGSRNKVSKITSVQRIGKYAPLTESGTIRVSGVDASNYVLLTTILSGILAHFSDLVPYCIHHIISHAWTAPLRWVCTLNFNICKDETYKDGYASWLHDTHEFTSTLGQTPKLLQLGFVLAVAPFLVALYSPLVVATFITFVTFWYKKTATNKSKVKFC